MPSCARDSVYPPKSSFDQRCGFPTGERDFLRESLSSDHHTLGIPSPAILMRQHKQPDSPVPHRDNLSLSPLPLLAPSPWSGRQSARGFVLARELVDDRGAWENDRREAGGRDDGASGRRAGRRTDDGVSISGIIDFDHGLTHEERDGRRKGQSRASRGGTEGARDRSDTGRRKAHQARSGGRKNSSPFSRPQPGAAPKDVQLPGPVTVRQLSVLLSRRMEVVQRSLLELHGKEAQRRRGSRKAVGGSVDEYMGVDEAELVAMVSAFSTCKRGC